MKRKNKEKGIFDRLKSIADIPGEVGSGFSLNMRGDREIYISGCRRILEYSRERIVLSIKSFSLVIIGECLICSSYFERAVGIEGRIDSISLERGEI